MKITNLEVDGYGVWSGLRIERLCDALNVFYGPNEAGKTTLLQFIRSMLYGFSPARQRYLPPLHGGRAGGTLDVASPHGRFQISRHDSAADGTPGEQLTLTAPDGTRQGEHFVKVLLSNVDETVFNNVFAVGLREIQELATLSDTEAAELLYNLTAGLDRVSLVEVLQELDASRNRILDAAGRPCQVLQLLAEHEKLRAEIEELGAVDHRYGHLAAEREQLHAEITQLEEEANRVERLARVADLALAVRDRWTQRAALDEQLSAIGPLKVMPEGAVERLDAVNARIRNIRNSLIASSQQIEALRVSSPGWPSTSRCGSGGADRGVQGTRAVDCPVAGPDRRIGKGNCRPDAELTAESERLGLVQERRGTIPIFAWTKTSRPPAAGGASTLPRFDRLAKRMQQRRRRWHETRQAAITDRRQRPHRSLEQIEAALAEHGQSYLTAALDRSGQLVSQYRRRVQIDERLDQSARHRPNWKSEPHGRAPTVVRQRVGRPGRRVRPRHGAGADRALPFGPIPGVSAGDWPSWASAALHGRRRKDADRTLE